MELEELLLSFEDAGYDWTLNYKGHKYEFILVRLSWSLDNPRPVEKITAIGNSPIEAIRNLLQVVRLK